MSINSRNRFANLSSEYTAAKYANRESDYDKYKRLVKEQNSFEEACYFLESVSLTDDYNTLSESIVNIENMDNDMISSFIESEFVANMDNSIGIIRESAEVTDAKKDLKKNSSVLISKTTDTIINTSKDLSIKLHALFNSDKKIYDKYIVALKTSGSLDGFAGISKINFPTKEIGDNVNDIVNVKDLNDAYKKLNKSVLHATDEDEVDLAADIFRKENQRIVDTYKKAEESSLEEKENWIPNAKEVSMMCTFINGDAVQKSISYNAKKIVDVLTDIESEAKKAYNELAADSYADTLELYKAEVIYKSTSILTKTALRKYNVYRDLTIREVAAMRKAFIICGKYANSRVANLNESVDDQYLFESYAADASDTYVFDKLMD